MPNIRTNPDGLRYFETRPVGPREGAMVPGLVAKMAGEIHEYVSSWPGHRFGIGQVTATVGDDENVTYACEVYHLPAPRR